jgi:tetratricopeptide (TPR) repeat protein
VTTTTALIVRISAALAMATHVVTASASRADPFAGCHEQFARNPDNYDSAYCFFEVTIQHRLLAEGIRLFEDLTQRHPHNLWLPLAHGHVFRTSDPARAEALYRRAADAFRAIGHADGELLARSNLRNFLFPRGRVEDATREMARVVEIGAATDDPLLKARAWTLEASHIQDTGGDLGLAYRLLKQTEAAIFPDGPYRLQRTTLNSLGLVAFRMGRFDEALAVFEKLDEFATAAGEGLAQANARYNILNTSALKETLLPTPGAKQRLRGLAERALAAGVAAQNREVTVKSHLAIAELLAESGSRAEALEHAESCLRLVGSYPHDEAACSWIRASLLREVAPEQSRAAALRALDATARANNPRTDSFSAGWHMRFSWDVNPRARAIQDSLAAIETIERLRSLQDDARTSAGLFSAWTSDYYWLSGRLLQDARDGDLELAFSITERMRARSLLDTLERSRTPPESARGVVENRRELLQSIAAAQRRLMHPATEESERRTTVEQLHRLELLEQEARRQIGLTLPGRATAPSFATLRAVQSKLADNEALLSFQVGLWETYDGLFGGGSWLMVLTRNQQAVHRLPDRARLVPMMPVFSGLIMRGDGLEATPAVRLYDELLSNALRQLPPGIDRIILVPDGALHQLPFDALRPGPNDDVLAARYELVVVPSATLWLHWREKGSRAATRKALAFADPELSVSGDSNATTRNAPLIEGLRLGRLPHARRESRALVAHFGAVDALVGERASEKALKDHNLRDYDILHFAAHAIADQAHPERSAVLLAAGGETEDGLLQAREIEDLDLDGAIVVLSACQTASGAVLSGEGVLSLARAFFQAGAQSVIGSRWPIRDEDAASMFDAFYRHLSEGASLSEALKRAKVEAIAARRPAAAWAGLVLLGDGDFRPFPQGRATSGLLWPRAAAILGMLTLLIAVVVWRLRGNLHFQRL